MVRSDPRLVQRCKRNVAPLRVVDERGSLHGRRRLPGTYGQTHSNPITAVQGIGDQAADVAAQLFVRKGTVIFAVSVATPLDEAQTPAYAQKRRTLASAIVSRL